MVGSVRPVPFVRYASGFLLKFGWGQFEMPFETDAEIFGIGESRQDEISEMVRSDSRSSWADRFSRTSMMNSLIDMPVMSLIFW